ncbi:MULTISPECIES: ABC transporter substrate-binding protein [unclassified Rhizobium]|uniref:ABC transporter substrate-binding protein n=1 Tax=unclassified Rhizobium TaxID=2613769 RepID=UPI001ADCE5BD|nr:MULTISPECIES: ABC transporter substrate-binding protein [unclassified Rhizobium]MBO9123739.1 ABC transporter substrate-binding protein [Rhizobium sp. 16-488-2b]MBO9174271.1 ABC transporter substrate-binding protein [Rhizobium sp. 16-488-2a]
MSDQTKLQYNLSRRQLLGYGAALGFAGAAGISPALAQQTPQVGGTLKVAAPGSATGSLDPHVTQGYIADAVRFTNLFDGLSEYRPDSTIQLVLAESFTPNSDATEWTVRIKKGVRTHSGAEFVADDVIYSVKRILDPAAPTKGSGLVKFIDPAGISKVDDHTVLFKLGKPYGSFDSIWANRYLRMVVRDFDPKNPVGTGPFKFVSFTPGQESMFEAFGDYFRGRAHADKLAIFNINDSTAAINALRGGQVDISYSMPFAEARTIKDDAPIKFVNNPSPTYLPIYMRTDIEPFNDVRVRQAMRLIANRKQMVNVALAGFGSVGNDMVGRTIAPCGESTLPQREQDIDEAKRLLSEAGKSNFTIDLVTTNGTAGQVECAQVFAEQARKAGVTINVKVVDMAAYVGGFLNWTFAIDFLTDLYLPMATRGLLPKTPFNVSHWDDPEFIKLHGQAMATSSETERCEIIDKMRTIEYERGGSIIWGFSNTLNGYRSNVHGLVPYSVDSPLYHLKDVSLS